MSYAGAMARIYWAPAMAPAIEACCLSFATPCLYFSDWSVMGYRASDLSGKVGGAAL